MCGSFFVPTELHVEFSFPPHIIYLFTGKVCNFGAVLASCCPAPRLLGALRGCCSAISSAEEDFHRRFFVDPCLSFRVRPLLLSAVFLVGGIFRHRCLHLLVAVAARRVPAMPPSLPDPCRDSPHAGLAHVLCRAVAVFGDEVSHSRNLLLCWVLAGLHLRPVSFALRKYVCIYRRKFRGYASCRYDISAFCLSPAIFFLLAGIFLKLWTWLSCVI